MTADDLIAFERRVLVEFEAGRVRGPVHCSGGNEDQLIEIFMEIRRGDFVFSNWRNHYHALLHGVPAEWVFAEILAGRSLSLNSAAHRFYTSAIVGGCLPIAVGVAAAVKRRGGSEHVWCFVGDMAASIGAFHDAIQYAQCNALPIIFVIEDNGLSTETPTKKAWGNHFYEAFPGYWGSDYVRRYTYKRTVPHYGSGKAMG
jgi:TPP-dependent pyruvate/acetoin dehydrogenase alpha subunit